MFVSRSFNKSKLLYDLLLYNPRNRIKTLLKHIHARAVTQPDKVMARAVEQVPTPAGVQIEENARHDNDLLLETRLEEIESVADALRHTAEIEPEVESRVGHVRELEAHFLQTANDIIALGAEMHLQSPHLVADARRREHLYGGFLEGHVAASVEVRAAGADGVDELLGTKDPRNTPSGKTETLREAVDDEHVVLVDIFDVVGGGNNGAVAVGCVVVSAVEFVHDQRSAVTADILDLCEFGVRHHLSRRVTRVGCKDNRSTTSDFLRNLVRRHMILVRLSEGNRDSSDVLEERQHLVVRRVIRNEESQVAIAQDSRNTDQPRTPTRHNAHVLPCVQALSPLAVVFVVQLRDCLAQRSDTGGGTVFSAVGADINLFWALEAALYTVVHLGRTLAQVGPFFGLVEEAVLVCLFCSQLLISGVFMGVCFGAPEVQTTPVEARVGSRPAWGLWPSCDWRNCLWMLEPSSAGYQCMSELCVWEFGALGLEEGQTRLGLGGRRSLEEGIARAEYDLEIRDLEPPSFKGAFSDVQDRAVRFPVS
jgi:hypothetical protein